MRMPRSDHQSCTGVLLAHACKRREDDILLPLVSRYGEKQAIVVIPLLQQVATSPVRLLDERVELEVAAHETFR